MAVEVVMPRMGLTMEEGTLVCWYKNEGDPVVKGEILFEIETDKVTTEVEASAEGMLGKILVDVGVTVPIGTPIAYIIAPGESIPAISASAPSGEMSSPEAALIVESALDMPGDDPRPRASPAARRTARELGLALNSVTGRGPRGRILETDVRRTWEQIGAQTLAKHRLTPVAARVAADLGIDVHAVHGSGPRGMIRKADLDIPVAALPLEGEVLEVSRAHKLMAERMAMSFSTAPHFYLTVQADASALVQLRRSLIEKIEVITQVRLTYTDLLLLFTASALTEQPLANAAWENGMIRMNPDVNIGVAVDTDRGLVVPVIPSTGKLSLAEVAAQRGALAEKARSGKLSLDDLTGGTFTFSNLGTFRVDTFNAILNPPQAAILAAGRIHEAVIPQDGQAVVRPVIGLSLTCDHRVLDGAAGARFLSRVVELVEEPYSLFI